MKGIGVAFSRFLETSYNTGLFIGIGIVFIYAVLGGMKGITYTQITVCGTHLCLHGTCCFYLFEFDG